MSARSYSLRSCPADGFIPDVRIAAEITRRSNILALRYVLHGALAKLVIPAPAARPERKHGLWQGTCFELFFAIQASPRYWEVNLSPAGHWNIYGFSDYRQGMLEEAAFTSLPFSIRKQPGALTLTLEMNLDGIVQADQVLEIGVSAVVEHESGEMSHWALQHQGSRADFHRRDSFCVVL